MRILDDVRDPVQKIREVKKNSVPPPSKQHWEL
jgi:hypothetical protein